MKRGLLVFYPRVFASNCFNTANAYKNKFL